MAVSQLKNLSENFCFYYLLFQPNLMKCFD